MKNPKVGDVIYIKVNPSRTGVILKVFPSKYDRVVTVEFDDGNNKDDMWRFDEIERVK